MIYVLIAAAVLIGAYAFRTFKARQFREQVLNSPLTEHERAIMRTAAPLVQKLPQEFHPALEGKVALFLNQVEFIGQHGLEVSDEMAISIAAQACLLVVNTDAWYDSLTTVLIYPGAFKSVQKQQDGYVVKEQDVIRSGESWTRGPVILSWQHSDDGARNTSDGHNVVLHEFAHQLDDLSGSTNAVPVLSPSQSFTEWRDTIVQAYESHVALTEAGRKSVLDPYGATAPEEFFAVAIEVFFERPRALKSERPELYAQLAKLLNLDPATWV